ncbi:3-hydroxyisobutyrate dehydrogenase-like beta-hydroxyacid dehydrogenase [Pseudochelatococcus lubricantis]|uniref:3-hydroxyisobutyrate dehydrogenase-like beta-hydroxyacid dehydrogenase n=2 Tax=Pseudochelatococcus lubricantis TaxID=1538102 RepID=A0ABX0V4E8_9HYPH|nr:NAD(P)-dependent oxidoreductase [Pseudochelatococcus lubricantis]NIJ60093.1 3-hydroxyisobutyrate dehydrogenase-like beta-hydroxyacid dehydrogenase [Pseudochelatococcus lubricantis]
MASMKNRNVGIIGVGLMGHGIASNIATKGWPLGYLRHEGNQPTENLDALGATGFSDRQELARASDVIILCVNGTPQVEAVLYGQGGVLEVIRPGTVIIDCSTAIPSSTEAIAAAIEAAGGRFLDAPMTRTPLEAAEGRLNLLIGGDKSLFEEMSSLLETFSENRFYAGRAGSGHKLKLLHNFVSLGFVTLLGEAAACAQTGGISPEVFVDVLRKGGGHGAALERVAPFILEGDPSRQKFAVSNAQKDLGYYVKMAGDLHAADAIASGVLSALDALVEHGFSQSYLSEAAAGFMKVARQQA